MLRVLKSFDNYGEPIGVNYKGEERYKTILGAILSICALLLVLAYAGVNGQVLLTRDKPLITFTNEYDDYPSAEEEFDLGEAELEAILTFHIETENGVESFERIDPKYGRIVAQRVEAEWPLPDGRRR